MQANLAHLAETKKSSQVKLTYYKSVMDSREEPDQIPPQQLATKSASDLEGVQAQRLQSQSDDPGAPHVTSQAAFGFFKMNKPKQEQSIFDKYLI